MITLVVFDWNGVLIADAKACLDAENYILEQYGRKPVSMKRYRETVSIPAKEFFLKNGFTPDEMRRYSRKMQEMFHAQYEPLVRRVRTRRNARRLLEWLSKRGITMIILSNHTREGIRPHLQRLSIGKYFTEVLANDRQSAMHKKNKRERLKSFLAKNRYRKDRILIIGDSPEEIEVGKLFGIKTVSITGGYYATRRLRELKPDHLISNLADMVRIVKEV